MRCLRICTAWRSRLVRICKKKYHFASTVERSRRDLQLLASIANYIVISKRRNQRTVKHTSASQVVFSLGGTQTQWIAAPFSPISYCLRLRSLNTDASLAANTRFAVQAVGSAFALSPLKTFQLTNFFLSSSSIDDIRTFDQRFWTTRVSPFPYLLGSVEVGAGNVETVDVSRYDCETEENTVDKQVSTHTCKEIHSHWRKQDINDDHKKTMEHCVRSRSLSR